MKQIIYIIKTQLIILFLVFFTSCADLFDLDVVPPDLISADFVFTNEALVESNIADLYQRFPFDAINPYSGTSGWHDLSTQRGNNFQSCRTHGNMTFENDCKGFWDYVYIRDINFFVENIKNANLPEGFRRRLEGEGRALRAVVYYEMQIRYGGVPLVDVVLDPFDDVPEQYLLRSTEEQLADFIDSELEVAIGLLGTNSSQKGRINRWTAFAYKAIANLWSASIAKFGTLSDNRLTGIPASRADEFYRKASASAREVINSGNYSLLQGADPVQVYSDIFLQSNHAESIYERIYNGVEINHQFTHTNQPTPFSQGQGSLSNPTLELIHFYENLDGTFGKPDLGPTNLYATGRDPWLDKDPRLYATVMFEGDIYAGLVVETYEGIDPTVGGTNPNAIIAQTGVSYQGKPTVGSASRLQENQFFPSTNFLLRKYVETTPQVPAQTEGNNWKTIRLAEMYLIVAESEFELGNLADAATFLNFTRDRVGLIPLDAGTITRDRVRIERTVELMYEGHRWYDLRRWRTALEEFDGQIVTGVRPIYHFDSGQYYFLVINGEQVQRVFRQEHYYNPITRARIQLFGELVENPGY